MFYLRINQNPNAAFSLAFFEEEINEDGRSLNTRLNFESVEEIDSIFNKLSDYLADKSIDVLEVLNDEGKVLYSTKAFDQVNNATVRLHTEQVVDKDEAMTYELGFKTDILED